MFYIILLSCSNVLLLLLLIILIRASLKVSRQVQMWEKFYESSIEDVDSTLGALNKLVSRRNLLSNDPDVQNMCQIITIIRDILIGYQSANGERKEQK